MEPTVSLDANALKSLIKESVREVMREEWFKFFELLIPYVDDAEQAEIEAAFSPESHPDSDFVDITNWFDDADQAQ
jgi:5,10-methylenetetrahydrofolate reductase